MVARCSNLSVTIIVNMSLGMVVLEDTAQMVAFGGPRVFAFGTRNDYQVMIGPDQRCGFGCENNLQTYYL